MQPHTNKPPAASPAEPAAYRLMRYSIVAVWLWTAGVSLWELNGQSAHLLHTAGLHNAHWQHALTIAGAIFDGVLGLWLLAKPSRLAYAAAFVGMAAMTLVATALLPSLWLHPLGPLSKNLPIAAALWLLYASFTAPQTQFGGDRSQSTSKSKSQLPIKPVIHKA